MTERAPRDRCRLPAPSWCDGGRALSGALHTDAQACAAELAKRRLPSASLVPRPDSPPTASSDDSTRATEPKTLRGPKRNHQRTQHTRLGEEEETTTTKRTQTEPPRRRPPTRRPRQDQDWRLARPYIPQFQHLAPPCLLLRPSFQLLWEASRKGAGLSPPPRAPRGGRENHSWPRSKEIHSPKIRPPPYMTFDPHRPSPTPKRGENRRE